MSSDKRPPHQDNHEQEFLKSVQKTLHAATTELDEKTCSALRDIRDTALHSPPPATKWIWLGSVGAITAGVSILAFSLLVAQPEPQPSSINNSLSFIEDLELISSAGDFELYDNLDFYLWLDEFNES